jgi:hypothetical protein
LGIAALLPEHYLLHAVIAHILHSLVGSVQSPSKFCVHT